VKLSPATLETLILLSREPKERGHACYLELYSSLAYGTIYNALRKLRATGLIIGDNRSGYELTTLGKKYLETSPHVSISKLPV
jgi:DNA-binding PadR family transcriptional regulator